MKYPPKSGEPQLYDLKNDPGEKVNLASSNPERVKQLSSLLNEWYVPSERQAGKFASSEKKAAREKQKAARIKSREAK